MYFIDIEKESEQNTIVSQVEKKNKELLAKLQDSQVIDTG